VDTVATNRLLIGSEDASDKSITVLAHDTLNSGDTH
jgi:hypothetical protein